MKKYSILIIVMLLCSIGLFGQVPNQFKYQAMIRDGNGQIISNSPVMVGVIILKGSPNGQQVFTEIHNTNTDSQGAVFLNIGSLSDMSNISWETDIYFIEISVNGITMGASQLISVPYAIHAKTAESISGTINEIDPVFISWDKSTGISITESQISNFGTYLTNYTETDPLFVNWDKTTGISITESQISDLTHFTNINEIDPLFANWDKTTGISITESQISDLTHFTNTNETDPIYTASFDLTDVETNDILKFDGIKFVKFTPNYLITEIDGSITNEIQDLELSSNTLKITNNANAANIDLSGYLDNTDNQTLSDILTTNNDGGAKQIKNISNPTEPQDVVTRAYLDAWGNMILTVIESNGLTVVDFSSDLQTGSAGITINFTDNSAIVPTSWEWNFGDGNTSSEQNPSHIYATNGIYTVSLTASNILTNGSQIKNNYITIAGPVAGNGVTDYNGNTYQTVIIGSQEWMAENLKTTRYSNGQSIPLITNNTTWKNLSDSYKACCYYNNSSSSNYGVLYTWAAAMKGTSSSSSNPSAVQGVCPTGWHLPSSSEWTELNDYLANDVGGKLKETGVAHWDATNSTVTNETGFTALPGGGRNGNVKTLTCTIPPQTSHNHNVGCYSYIYDGSFVSEGSSGIWWTSTQNATTTTKANTCYLRDSSNNLLFTSNYYKSRGFSIRCVKN